MRTYKCDLTMQEQLNSHPYRGSDSWTEDKSIRRVIIVKRDIAAALSSSTVCLCPSAVCRVHNYTHTHTQETGYVLHKQLFRQSSSSTGVAMTTKSFILQIPSSCPWWGIVITPPQHQNGFFVAKNILNISKSSTFLPFDLFPCTH